MTKKEKILHYLRSIYPLTATNAEIRRALAFNLHQDAYYATRDLRKAGLISGKQIGREWHFKANDNEKQTINPSNIFPKVENISLHLTWQKFEVVSRQIFSSFFQTQLLKGTIPGVNKRWDMISTDGNFVGDSKYLQLVGRKRLPPAKFSMIAKHVWLLEKIKADTKFLVFGNQIEVPKMWLEKYGNLVSRVDFYFLDDEGQITKIR